MSTRPELVKTGKCAIFMIKIIVDILHLALHAKKLNKNKNKWFIHILYFQSYD